MEAPGPSRCSPVAARYSKQSIVEPAIAPGGAIVQVQRWVVRVEGEPEPLVFASDPTDDEILARLPQRLRLRGSQLADRVEAVADAALAWYALERAVVAAQADATVTAQERSRLLAARDLAWAQVKALV